MYHHQGKNDILSSRHLFPRGDVNGDSGLVLSTDAKPRLKWTSELHERFIEAVNQLGGADKATPKTVMRLMGIPGLTLYHLKSHLQKYRLSKNMQAQANIGTTKNGCGEAADRMSGESGSITSNTNTRSETNKTMEISEALMMQIEVQRQLNEQLEVQRHLQLRIEAQGKYLQSVLEKAQETLGNQNLGGAPGLESAKVQLSELVSKVSSECLTDAFQDFKETPRVHFLQAKEAHLADCSMDSCLTSFEESQKENDLHNINSGLRNYQGNSPLSMKLSGKDVRLGQRDLNECKMFSSPTPISPIRGDSIRAQRNRDGQEPENKKAAVQQERGSRTRQHDLPCLTVQLDLNIRNDNDAASGCRQFDLNGFSWN